MSDAKIIWTKTDESPLLASYSLLPMIKAFIKGSGISLETKNISLAGRVIANFPDKLTDAQKIPDHLAELAELTQNPQANIIKLPNISASIPQLQRAILELQKKGYDIPSYPEELKNDEEKALRIRFSKLLGSAVNPVLREGNSDRRAATSVKKFARKNPHKMMKAWPATGSRTKVAFMNYGDFYGSEKSHTMKQADTLKIEHIAENGIVTELKSELKVQQDEIIDAATMNIFALKDFYASTFEEAKRKNVLLSLHLKATMMKISDPIMFGHAVLVYYKSALEKHADSLKKIGANVNNGLSDILDKLDKLPADEKAEIEADINAVYATQPDLAMVDSRKGITNLHAPNLVIIDASMPNVVRDGGKMWNKNNEPQDTIAIIPDRCYATIYQTIIEDCQANGQFDPSTMGSVSNVGLMAQKAEEYGSHDKTFEATENGKIRAVDSNGETILEQTVAQGDIFRMCQAKDAPIRNWVKLAVSRAQATQTPAVFWLDEKRGHDAEMIKKVNLYLKDHDLTGLDIQILSPDEAMRYTLARVRKGLDTISVTGNVLRDFLTDLFPILELGTSARLLSIVPLMKGGGLFETGAAGSAPMLFTQFLQEGHLSWDSLGEYCALVSSFEKVAYGSDNKTAALLAETLDEAISMYLENGKSPSMELYGLDNRESSFYLSLYWARALSTQAKDGVIKAKFDQIYKELLENEAKIYEELLASQGNPVDLGGYYLLNNDLATKALRPSSTFNSIIDSM